MFLQVIISTSSFRVCIQYNMCEKMRGPKMEIYAMADSVAITWQIRWKLHGRFSSTYMAFCSHAYMAFSSNSDAHQQSFSHFLKSRPSTLQKCHQHPSYNPPQLLTDCPSLSLFSCVLLEFPTPICISPLLDALL